MTEQQRIFTPVVMPQTPTDMVGEKEGDGE